MRRVLVLVALVAVAGCVGPLVDSLGDRRDADDPASDVKGWEDGIWYNESIDVTTSDGLSDAELERVVARAKARVEHIRDVEFDGSVSVRTISRSEFGGGGGDSTPKPAFRTFDNAKMEALLLIGEDEDSLGVQRQNRQVSVGGYYAPGRDTIVVVTDGETAVLEETTLAHELMHAWQDQQFGLESFRGSTRDESNALDGIVEGDANFVEHRYDQRCGVEWSCVSPPEEGEGGGGGGLANYGVFVMKFFPYADGPAFVASRYRAAGWPAVNEVYRNPPASAEQVAHPAKYGRDAPTNVDLRDRTAPGWERVRPPDRKDYAVLGQSAIAAMFVYPMYHSEGETAIVPQSVWFNRTGDELSDLDPLNYGFGYAAGWDGDRLHVYRNEAGETGYVWRIVWDSPSEAREFYTGYRKVLAYWGAERVGNGTFLVDRGPFADAIGVVVEGDTVTIVNAPTLTGLDEVWTPFDDGGPAPTTVTPTPTPTPVTPAVPTPGFGLGVAAMAILLAALAAGLAGRRE